MSNYTAGKTLHLGDFVYECDSAAEAVAFLKLSVVDSPEAVVSFIQERDYEGPQMCECELDWNCYLCDPHRTNYTAIERRNDYYASMDF